MNQQTSGHGMMLTPGGIMMPQDVLAYQPLILHQKGYGGELAEDTFYLVLAEFPELNSKAATREELADVGLVKIFHELDMPLAVYHHLPSGSTIKVGSGPVQPYVEIYGGNRTWAKNDLVAFVAKKCLMVDLI